MEISPQTTTHVYLQGKECLHVLATADQLRVRWMRDGVWVLRWNARINDEGLYIDEYLDGEIVGTIDDGLTDYPHADILFQCMKEASTRLPLYPNPNIIRELEWFVLDDAEPPLDSAESATQ